MMSDKKHFATLDGLRGIAAIFVLALHWLDPTGRLNRVPHAALAVDFFFMLSGFVVAYAYEKRLTTHLSVTAFLRVRLVRLYPLAFLGLFCGFFVFGSKLAHSHLPMPWTALPALGCGLLLCPSPWELGEGWGSAFPYNIPSWSLFFEFVVNIAYAAAVKRLTLRVLKILVAVCGVALLAQYAFGGNGNVGAGWKELYLGLGRTLFPFFCGVLIFRLSPRMQDRGVRWGSCFLFVSLFALLASPITPFERSYSAAAVFLAFPLIVFWGAADEPPQWMPPTLTFIGRLSYPIYILHYPTLRIFSNYFRNHKLKAAHLYFGLAAEFLFVVVFAMCAMLYFDEPLRARLNRISAYRPRPEKAATFVS